MLNLRVCWPVSIDLIIFHCWYYKYTFTIERQNGYCTHCWNNVIWSMLFILQLKWEINVDINDANKQKLVRSSIFIINLFLFFFLLNFYNCKSCCMRNWLFYCMFSILHVFISLFSFYVGLYCLIYWGNTTTELMDNDTYP